MQRSPAEEDSMRCQHWQRVRGGSDIRQPAHLPVMLLISVWSLLQQVSTLCCVFCLSACVPAFVWAWVGVGV